MTHWRDTWTLLLIAGVMLVAGTWFALQLNQSGASVDGSRYERFRAFAAHSS